MTLVCPRGGHKPAWICCISKQDDRLECLIMTKSLYRHCTFKTVLEWKRRRSGFSAEMQRREEKAQKWLAVADCSRHEQRRPGRLDRRQWRVEFGGQSVMKMRPSAVAVEPRDQLFGRVRRWGTAVPTHAGICIRGRQVVLSQSVLEPSANGVDEEPEWRGRISTTENMCASDVCNPDRRYACSH